MESFFSKKNAIKLRFKYDFFHFYEIHLSETNEIIVKRNEFENLVNPVVLLRRVAGSLIKRKTSWALAELVLPSFNFILFKSMCVSPLYIYIYTVYPVCETFSLL